MIFITVGTQKFQFNRLLKTIDNLIENKDIVDKVICQAGYSTYSPKNYKTIKFMSQSEYNQNIKNCDLLITHAGVGTILEAKKNNKTVIVVPRLKKYKEHVDDHQQQIAYGFSKKEIVLESDCSNLKSVLDKAQEIRLKEYKFNNKVFIHKLNDILDGME